MPNADPATLRIATSALSAEIATRGAELVQLQDEAGRDLLWSGDPAFWAGRAPLLFPIVGRLKDDAAIVGCRAYPMRQHGIARTATFTVVEHDETSCRLRLDADAQTRAAYPFDFRLDVTYRLTGATLDIRVDASNLGAAPMPASFGFHPALRWPLPYGGERGAHHTILFERDETAPLATLNQGLIQQATAPNPVHDRRLALDDALFTRDALIFLTLASRSLRYGVEGGRSLTVDFPDMPYLGLWTKPGAGFLCIEPWAGYASPEEFDGDLADKPGMVSIAPGDTRAFGMRITIDDA